MVDFRWEFNIAVVFLIITVLGTLFTQEIYERHFSCELSLLLVLWLECQADILKVVCNQLLWVYDGKLLLPAWTHNVHTFAIKCAITVFQRCHLFYIFFYLCTKLFLFSFQGENEHDASSWIIAIETAIQIGLGDRTVSKFDHVSNREKYIQWGTIFQNV